MPSKHHGVLLHPACLPGRFGCGDLGPEAWQWLDVLGDAGVESWALPVHMEDLNLLSFELLHHDGALLAEDMRMLPVFDDVDVNPAAVHEVRWAFLHLAARRFVCQCEASPLLRRAFESFCDAESAWLDDVALFGALKDDAGGRGWATWPEGIRTRQPAALAAAMVSLEPQIEERKALHYLLSRQWRLLRSHSQKAGVTLMAVRRRDASTVSLEGWTRELSSLSDIRALQLLDGLVTEAALEEPEWLHGAKLFGHTTREGWRFHWSQVNEDVLKQLLGA